MQTKLTVIVDNIPQEPLHGEWGLSILAAHRGSSILIDAGASGLFAENMRARSFHPGRRLRDAQSCALRPRERHGPLLSGKRDGKVLSSRKRAGKLLRPISDFPQIHRSSAPCPDGLQRPHRPCFRRLSAFRWRVSDRAQDAGLIADRKARTDVSENGTRARAG